MDYSDLVVDDMVRISLTPEDYRVIEVEKDRVVLEGEDSLIELVRTNREWKLVSDNLPLHVEQKTPLPTDDPHVLYQILNKLTLDDLINVCQSNNRFFNVCQTDEYWKPRLLSKFGDNLRGIFLSGPEKLPILEGHHSFSEYTDVEHRLNRIFPGPLVMQHRLVNSVYKEDEFYRVDELMYILRWGKDQGLKSENFSNFIFGVVVSSIVNDDYPVRYMTEYLSMGHPKYIDAGDWENLVISTFEDDEYYDLWNTILKSIDVDERMMRYIMSEWSDFDYEDNYIINLLREYGYQITVPEGN